MTSTGTTTKYNTSTSNLFNRRQQGDYTTGSSTYLSSAVPRRSNQSQNQYQKFNSSRFEDTDGEDEKKLLSLSERIKKLSTSRVLKDNSKLTHNNNEPFTYLRTPASFTNTNTNIHERGRKTEKVHAKPGITNNNREVIYAQVVVDPDERNYSNLNNQSISKNKRTVHRSYNNNTYDSGIGIGGTSTNANKMKGRNITTVLLNSSSDDIPSSLNIDEKIGSSSRFRSSSSPLLASNDDYYPKSPGIVLRTQQFQNGYNSHNSRSRYDNHFSQRKGDYLPSDDDNYFVGLGTRTSTSTKYRGSSGGNVNSNNKKYGYEYQENKDRSPFTKDITTEDDDFYDYQPLNYNKNRNTTNTSSFMDSYNKTRVDTQSQSFMFDEEDEYDVTRNTKFEDRRSKTLDRGVGSFSNNNNRLASSSEFNRSRTLDNRISNQRDLDLDDNIIIDPKGSIRNQNEPPMNFKVTTTTKKDLSAGIGGGGTFTSGGTSTSKSKSTGGSGNLFSTLLRRNQKDKKVDAKSSENLSSSKSNLKTSEVKKAEKKSGTQSTNFFTSFLEKKRRNKQQNNNTDLTNKKTKGQSQLLKADNNTSSTYQSYTNNWAPPATLEPPTFSVVDYSDPLLSSPVNKHYYGENNDTEDSNANASDIWKKSYGTDLTKVKRRWTMREPSNQKPSVIREEEDLTTRTLGRKTSHLGSSTGLGAGLTSSSKSKSRNYSLERDDRNIQTAHYDTSNNKKKYFGGENSSSSPKLSSRNKYNTIESRSRYSYSPEKSTPNYQHNKYDDYDPTTTTGYSNNNTLTKRGRQQIAGSNNKLSSKGYTYGGGGGFIGGGTPNSSGSESNNRNQHNLLNGSLRSVYLHEAAVIPEMPRTASSGGGGGASISGLSGRRTLSKDEISNYSGPRKEAKQLSRSMSVAHPWGPNKHYRDRYKELDYSHTNNLHLPPRPPSRSPSGTGSGLNYRPSGAKASESNVKRQQQSQSRYGSSNRLLKPPPPSGPSRNTKKHVSSSSVESLLRQDTPDQGLLLKKKGNSKLGRSKSISVPSGQTTSKDGKNNSRFSTLWFNKRNPK